MGYIDFLEPKREDVSRTLSYVEKRRVEKMRAYNKKEQKIFVFNPIRKREKFQTNERWLKSLDTSRLAEELAKIVEWDRTEVKKTKGSVGLVRFMKKWLTQEHEEHEENAVR